MARQMAPSPRIDKPGGTSPSRLLSGIVEPYGEEAAMSATAAQQPIVHFVGSIPLPDAETVFRTLAAAAAPRLKRLPDGETGIRKTWIRFLQQVLADNPAIEVASDVPPFKFTQWDGTVLREIPRLRVKPGARLEPATVSTGYADMAIASWRLFDRLQREGVIPTGVRFQISLPTPIAPTYNNVVPTDRPALIPVLTAHMLGEVAAIAKALPHDRIALQWDVCQEVIAWEGYYEPGPIDFRQETIAELTAIGNGVPTSIELGYHLCYGSPADEHVIQPKNAGIMVEMTNAVSAGVRRPIQFFHLPVPQPRTDDAFFAPLSGLKLPPETELYFGLVHRDDMAGNAARLTAARRHARVDGVATECGMARGDPERFPALLAAHVQTAELVA
ncbi:MAG TPA: hypothetical protein VMB34_10955 [Acetobacteraceae bacterium]|nr:hypothetical protein [Acetobacteraceae bacterium]